MRVPERMRDLPLLGAIFFFSIPLLSAEVLMLRATLIAFGPDFPYLIIPLALFGLGIGAGLSYLTPERKWRDMIALSGLIFTSFTCVMFGSVFILSGPTAAFVSFASAIAAYTGAGVITSLVFRMRRDAIAALYAADLSGAAVGTLLAPALLGMIGWSAVPVVLAVASFATALFALLARRYTTMMIALVATLFFSVTPFLHPPVLSCGAMQESDAIDNAYAHLSVRKGVMDNVPVYVLTYDCGATVSSIAVGKTLAEVEPLTKSLSAVPIAYVAAEGKLNDVLVSAAGGGSDIVRAELFGARNIDAIEIDPAVISLADRLSGASINPYGQQNVSVYIDDSRHILLRNPKTYDLEFALRSGLFGTTLSGADTPVYNVTVESTQELLRRLKPDGLLAFARFETPEILYGEGVHVTRSFKDPAAIAQAALRREHIDPTDKIAVIGASGNSDLALILVKRDGWSPGDLAQLSEISNARGYGTPVVNSATNTHAGDLLTDDMPFFTMLEGGKILASLLFFALLLLALLAWASARRIAHVISGETWLRGMYFAVIGAGFIIFELAALVRSELLFARPDYAPAFALACIFLSAGAASALTAHIRREFAHIAIILSFVGLTASVVLFTTLPQSVVEQLLALPLIFRSLALALPLCLGGFAGGLYVPLGFSSLMRTLPVGFVPWAWGIDAAAGVIGGFTIKLLFHTSGISAAFWSAILLYFLATLAFVVLVKEVD